MSQYRAFMRPVAAVEGMCFGPDPDYWEVCIVPSAGDFGGAEWRDAKNRSVAHACLPTREAAKSYALKALRAHNAACWQEVG
jgi:hypothetical protein